MMKNIEEILYKLGFRSTRQQRVILVILLVVFVYFLGYSLGSFISHLENNGLFFWKN